MFASAPQSELWLSTVSAPTDDPGSATASPNSPAISGFGATNGRVMTGVWLEKNDAVPDRRPRKKKLPSMPQVPQSSNHAPPRTRKPGRNVSPSDPGPKSVRVAL